MDYWMCLEVGIVVALDVVGIVASVWIALASRPVPRKQQREVERSVPAAQVVSRLRAVPARNQGARCP